MRRIFIYNVTVFFLFAFLVSSCGGKGENAVKGEKTGSESNLESTEWIELFNGKNFEGWISLRTGDEPPEGWKIENGEIVISGLGGKDADKAGDIITEKKYSDFELEFEWKMFTVGGNSGLKYYVNFYGENGGGPALGLEYQILDDDNHPWMLDGRMQPGDFHTVASCYELYAAVGKEVSPLGEWNSSKIISQNGQVEHWLNGKKSC